VFYNYKPDIFSMMEMKVLQFDDSIISAVNKTEYIADFNKYSIVPFRAKTEPRNAWAIPIVTGHKYKIHWQKGLDFEQMQVTLSPHWKPTDKDIYIIHNFTDVRVQVDFLTAGDNIKNLTLLPTNNAPKQTGVNAVYNQTAVREIHYLLNGKNSSRSDLVMKGYRCIGSCLPAVNKVAITGPQKLWSEPTTWKTGVLPKADEDVEVPPGEDILYDLEDSPIYRYIQINGRLTFKPDAPKLHLRAKYIFVRAGEFLIGNETNPHLGDAKITLYGMKQDQHIVYDNAIEAGNKILANTGLMSFWGAPRPITRTRLLKTANSKDLTIYVEPGLSWNSGDKVALPSTNIRWSDIDFGIISSYDNVTGELTLDRPLSNYHWGAATSTGSKYSGVDMRGEVMILSKNIKISGFDTDAWGCQIVTSDFQEGNGEQRVGQTYFDNVEIHNCSQYDTYKAALRFEGAKLGDSRISNSAIHHGLGMAIDVEFSENIMIQNNNIFNFQKYGVNILTSKDITLDGNWVFGIYARNISTRDMQDTIGAILACAHFPGDKCYNIRLTNNIAASVQSAGVDTVGYSVPGHECGDYQNIVFKDNIAHSISGNGANIYRSFVSPTSGNCIEASYFVAYKCKGLGVVSN
jgi:G8 domain/Right handed beta helix region